MSALTVSSPNLIAGAGVTVCGWSDRYAYTVLEISPSGHRIVAQRDHAARANAAADIVTPGGFCAHVEHPEGQLWTYERDRGGDTIVILRGRDGRYRVRGTKATVLEGRHEYRDYNF